MKNRNCMAILAAAFVIPFNTVQADQLTMLTDFGLPKISSPLQFLDVNGTLFFVAGVDRYGPLRGGELWRSDGTTAGTFRIKNGRPWYLINVNGTLFFVIDDEMHGDELWKSDGTEAGTVLVKDIFPGSTGSRLSPLADVNGTLFFRAYDGVHGTTLWKSDGTTTGTVLVGGVVFPWFDTDNPPRPVNLNGTLFFEG